LDCPLREDGDGHWRSITDVAWGRERIYLVVERERVEGVAIDVAILKLYE
jgi:hypothetical protein